MPPDASLLIATASIAPTDILFGVIVGLSLGLTGGGGAIFAVPLLVYGSGVPAHEAKAISLAAVGATSLVGFLSRWKAGQVELHTGLVFALAGMISAPAGKVLADDIPETLLMTLFAGVMVVVAVRMWQKASAASRSAGAAPSSASPRPAPCQRNAAGELVLSTRCVVLLGTMGLATGLLAGLFGVGGGFVIVPALVLFGGMAIRSAVGTSLMVITLVSISGVGKHVVDGDRISLGVTLAFILGGVGGLFVGQAIGRRLSGAALQKMFAVAILAVAALIVVRNLTA